jgi:hypothetical protein
MILGGCPHAARCFALAVTRRTTGYAGLTLARR